MALWAFFLIIRPNPAILSLDFDFFWRSSYFPISKNSQKILKNPENCEESRSGLGSWFWMIDCEELRYFDITHLDFSCLIYIWYLCFETSLDQIWYSSAGGNFSGIFVNLWAFIMGKITPTLSLSLDLIIVDSCWFSKDFRVIFHPIQRHFSQF